MDLLDVGRRSSVPFGAMLMGKGAIATCGPNRGMASSKVTLNII